MGAGYGQEAEKQFTGWESSWTQIRPPRVPPVRGPWQANSHGVKVVASGQGQEPARAPCPQCQGSAHRPHGSHVPSSPSQAGREGLRGTRRSPPLRCPPTMITVEGSRAGRGQRVLRSPFHPSTSGPFPPFVTQFGSITPALAPGHVPGSEVMDSTAGEISPVGCGVGGLLARLHGVGRARGFLSQRPTRHPARGPLPVGFAPLPSPPPGH